ncbi:MAG: 3-hydroxybutyryl-CoA dehydrogenase [Halobacteriales archaeon SW_9_67_25]|jgi:3-hydroxybutyryl-CoA dehydrogenase|nr:MAG: 3-hydroxybutyryl-CoA dehydrogenase [Halobacteriales archaeon SW_9_67_25]
MDVAVLGAGAAGRAIAQLCAVAGHPVSLHDGTAAAAMDGIDTVEQRLDAAVDTRGREAGTRASAVENLQATTGLEAAVADADVVLETATTESGALQKRFADIEDHTDRETLLVPTTGVAVTAAAAGLRHPDRAVGMRFQDPLKRPLVEVIVAEQTSRETFERATAFVDGIDRSPVAVRDVPGAVATRTVLALEVEAMRLVEDGVAGVEAVDDAVRLGHDHPVGPLESADRAGLDRRLETLESLGSELGARFDPPELLRELVSAGTTGTAAGEGFYVWEDGQPTEPAVAISDLPGRERGPDDPGR